MATLEAVLAAVKAEDPKIDSLIALVKELKTQVGATPGLTPEQQAQIDEIFDAVSDNADRIQTAIDAPAEPPSPTEPPV